jgi:hypothetical protein
MSNIYSLKIKGKKILPLKLMRRWEDNIKMAVRERGCFVVGQIEVLYDKVQACFGIPSCS